MGRDIRQAYIAAAAGAAMTFAGMAVSARAADEAAFDGSWRGMIVCEKLDGSPDVLRAPVDVRIAGGAIILVRPVFNLAGSRVVGTEIATGRAEPDGKFTVASKWSLRGVEGEGRYAGLLTARGATFTGSQKLTGVVERPDRGCTGALVR